MEEMVYARNWYEINNCIDYTERNSIYFHINQQTFIIYIYILLGPHNGDESVQSILFQYKYLKM